jgi:hypothetical protein
MIPSVSKRLELPLHRRGIVAANRKGRANRGGATQIWLDDELIDDPNLFDWSGLDQAAELLPQF